MSIIETNEKMSKKMIHWKNDSGEIDVFEAAKYFSNANEEYYSSHQNFQNKNKQSLRNGRMSFDMPIIKNSSSFLPSQNTTTTTYIMDQKPMMKNNKDQNKKYKQPSSPGGRLASFLNSLFNQTSSKKKKSSKSLKDHEDESPNGRRKRRSSISHFSFRSSSITTTNQDSSSKSIYSSSNSGFRTPPPYAYTPTKSYKEMTYNQERSNLQERLQERTNLQNEDYSWLDEKLKLSKSGDKFVKNNSNNGLLLEKNKTYNKVVNADDDEDGDSDSSSDLFDLPNIDLDYYSSSGLPVYETTNMDNIKRGAPISSGAI